MRVLFFRNIGGLVDFDIIDSLRQMNIEVDYLDVDFKIKENIDEKRLIDIEESIKNFQPDLLFATNDIALDCQGKLLNLYDKLGLHLICWWVDEPSFAFSEPWVSIFKTDLVKLLMIDRFWVESAKDVGISNVWHLPLAVNLQRLQSVNFPDERNNGYDADVSFVGRLGSDWIKFFMNRIIKKKPQNFNKLVEIIDKTSERYLNDYTVSIKNHLTDVINQNDVETYRIWQELQNKRILKEIYYLVDFMVSFKQRRDVVKSLINFGITVYGEKDWQDFIPHQNIGTLKRLSDNFALYYYGEETAKIYHYSKINLNITKFQLKTAVNQRIFDVPACGGFLLTDYRKDLDMLFDIEKEVVIYQNIDDLKRKTQHFLENPDDRKNVIFNAQDRIKSEHTYQHRLRKMFDLVQ